MKGLKESLRILNLKQGVSQIIYSFFLVIVYLFVFVNGTCAKDIKIREYSLNVVPEYVEKNQYKLVVSLCNTGKTSLVLHPSNLPWKSSSNMTLIALKDKGNFYRLIDGYRKIQDPRGADIKISPGETISGEILLRNRFPDISNIMNRYKVIVFWVYKLKLIDGSFLENKSGWFEIPITHPVSLSGRP